MGTLKAKNSSGEWIEFPVQMNNEFKYEFVSHMSNDIAAIDLSPYVEKNADFMLIYRTSVNSSGQAQPQVYIHSDGAARQFTNSTGNLTGFDTLMSVFPESTQLSTNKISFDEETLIFRVATTAVGQQIFNNALLIYVG